jgi:hypothetical protein
MLSPAGFRQARAEGPWERGRRFAVGTRIPATIGLDGLHRCHSRRLHLALYDQLLCPLAVDLYHLLRMRRGVERISM